MQTNQTQTEAAQSGLLMPETESLATKVVILVDKPSGIRNKESTSGLETLKAWPFNGGRANIYIYWGLESWNDADLSGVSALDVRCHAPLSESFASILRILEGNQVSRVAVGLNCACSGEQLAELRNRGCAIMPARTVNRHVSKVMKDQLVREWMAGSPISLPMAPGDPAILAADIADPTAAPLHQAIARAQSAQEHERIVFAVVSPPRSGSMALADFLSLSVPARFPVFHEHTWAAADGGVIRKESKHQGGNPAHMRRGMTEAFLAEPAPYRFVFSLHRNPIQRLHSYFAKRSKERFMAPNFDIDAVRQEFEIWARKNVKSYLRWLDVDWPDMIGFRQSEMDVIAPGIRHREDSGQSVTLIETSSLGTITQVLLEQYGRERYPALKLNSMQELGLADHYDEFVESCPVPESLVERLRAHPEVQALG
jgi:hypothetical protein